MIKNLELRAKKRKLEGEIDKGNADIQKLKRLVAEKKAMLLTLKRDKT